MAATDPLVSVCVVTYNQESFIGPCLQSILDQETSFNFELIVGDDNSSDRTRDILSDFANSDSRVRLMLRPSNIGPTQNYIDVHNQAKGTFVAHLDGDDLAAPGKLSRQVSLLEAHNDLVACGHRMALIDESGSARNFSYPVKLGTTFDLNKLIRVGMPVFASSIMYRKECRTILSSTSDLFDWYLLSDILQFGRAGYLRECLGFYRMNRQSVVSTLGSSEMHNLMTELRLLRLSQWPERRAEFFAHALFQAAVNIKKGAGLTPQDLRLLRESISLNWLCPFIDAGIWATRNRPAYVR